MSERELSLDELMPLIRERLAEGQSVRFLPRGTSMLPMLRQGRDSVTLSALPEQLKKYDLPLYQRSDGQYVIHRVIKADVFYTCVGDNQFAYEPGLKREQMIALVTEFTRDGKTIRTDHPGYRLYCRFWHATRPVRYHCWRFKRLLKRILRK